MGIFSKKEKSIKDNKTTSKKRVKEARKKLSDQLAEAINDYNEVHAFLCDSGTKLLNQRIRSIDLISHAEVLVNSIANHPKSFVSDIEEIEIEKEKFKGICEYANEELKKAKESAVQAGMGVAGGVAVASLAPTTAMWIATTFGTASTGTAISTLSGAAATKAALAWLGGGAIAAGGGGTAAGTALLAMAGPIGWGIAGVSLLTSILLFANNRIKSDKRKKEEIESVIKNTYSLRKNFEEINALFEETQILREKLMKQFDGLMRCYGKDFRKVDELTQMELGAFVNNTKSLACLLSKGINSGRTE